MNFYPKILAMVLLLVFIPPVGLIFMYKFSPFKLKTNIAIATACIGFFIYAQYTSPNSEDLKLLFTGGQKKAPYEMTAEEFRERFNKKSAELARQLNMQIREHTEVGINNEFGYEFNENLILKGKVGDNENVKEIVVTADPKNQDESFQTIVCIGLIISVFNPELNQDERSAVFNDLKMYVENSTANMNEKTSRGNIQYSVQTDENKKVTFTAEVKKPID